MLPRSMLLTAVHSNGQLVILEWQLATLASALLLVANNL